MAAPAPSRLDGNQVLQGSFDESTGRLRTDSLATVVNADIDVSLDASEDNVAIADPDGNFLNINPDGSINANIVTGSPAIRTSNYNEVSNVAMGVTTLLITYTLGTGENLQKVVFSGTNIAEYELVIDGLTQDKKRTYFGGALNDNFDFNEGLDGTPGQIIEVYVVHNRPFLGDFNARIQIVET